MTGASIEVQGLTKVFSGREALCEASFRYEGAGAIGYLGPNGAGKTTTLKLLTGLLRPTRGTALINDINVMQDRKRALAGVGAVIETPEPYPSQTVAEAIEMAGEFRGGPSHGLDREIRDLGAVLDLPPWDARCGQLSKGQRQRVSIAASLVRNPSVLILDEPTNGLDPKERILIRNVLNDLKKDHLVLMSSHLMAEVTDICGQVIFINQGRIILRDTVENVANRFRSRAIEVEFDAPVPMERIQRLGPLVGEVVALSERRFRITFDGSKVSRGELLRQLEEVATVITYQSASLVLEDAYLALMQNEGPNTESSASTRSPPA